MCFDLCQKHHKFGPFAKFNDPKLHSRPSSWFKSPFAWLMASLKKSRLLLLCPYLKGVGPTLVLFKPQDQHKSHFMIWGTGHNPSVYRYTVSCTEVVTEVTQGIGKNRKSRKNNPLKRFRATGNDTVLDVSIAYISCAQRRPVRHIHLHKGTVLSTVA